MGTLGAASGCVSVRIGAVRNNSLFRVFSKFLSSSMVERLAVKHRATSSKNAAIIGFSYSPQFFRYAVGTQIC